MHSKEARVDVEVKVVEVDVEVVVNQYSKNLASRSLDLFLTPDSSSSSLSSSFILREENKFSFTEKMSL